MTIPNIDAGTWADCLWTGVALRRVVYGDEHKEVLSHLAPHPVVILESQRAMPVDPMYMVDDLMTLMSIVDSWPLLSYDGSLVATLDVQCVPLKPTVSQDDHPEWFHALASSADGLDHLYPEKIIKLNIGSNRGLARILRTYHNANVIARQKTYKILNVDINIFARTFKV
jgi:hypothetical protein